MLIVCESCETRFRFDESLLPANGARVRCSRCQHRFHLAPPSLESEEPEPDAPDLGEPDITPSGQSLAPAGCASGASPEAPTPPPEPDPWETAPEDSGAEPTARPTLATEVAGVSSGEQEPDLENPEFLYDARRDEADDAYEDESEEADPPLLDGPAPAETSPQAMSFADLDEEELEDFGDALLDPGSIDEAASEAAGQSEASDDPGDEPAWDDAPLLGAAPERRAPEPTPADASPTPDEAEISDFDGDASFEDLNDLGSDYAETPGLGAESSSPAPEFATPPEPPTPQKRASAEASEDESLWAGGDLFDEPTPPASGPPPAAPAAQKTEIEVEPGRAPGHSAVDFAPAPAPAATPPATSEPEPVRTSSILHRRPGGSRAWPAALGLSILLVFAGGRAVYSLAGRGPVPHPPVEAAGWLARDFQTFHLRDSHGRRVLVIRGELEVRGAAEPPAIEIELNDASGARVQAPSRIYLTRLSDRDLGPGPLARRLSRASGQRAYGRIDGFTLLVPDPPDRARSFRVRLLGS